MTMAHTMGDASMMMVWRAWLHDCRRSGHWRDDETSCCRSSRPTHSQDSMTLHSAIG